MQRLTPAQLSAVVESNTVQLIRVTASEIISPLVIYVYTRSVTKRKRVIDPKMTVVVAKQIVLVTVVISGKYINLNKITNI